MGEADGKNGGIGIDRGVFGYWQLAIIWRRKSSVNQLQSTYGRLFPGKISISSRWGGVYWISFGGSIDEFRLEGDGGG